jgi:hypothetical protein
LSEVSDDEFSLELASKIEVDLNDFFIFGCSCVCFSTFSTTFSFYYLSSSSICSNDCLLPIPNLAFGLLKGAAERTGRGRLTNWFAPLIFRNDSSFLSF